MAPFCSKVPKMQNGFHPRAALPRPIRQLLFRPARLDDLHLRPHFRHHPTTSGQSQGLDSARIHGPTHDARLLDEGAQRGRLGNDGQFALPISSVVRFIGSTVTSQRQTDVIPPSAQQLLRAHQFGEYRSQQQRRQQKCQGDDFLFFPPLCKKLIISHSNTFVCVWIGHHHDAADCRHFHSGLDAGCHLVHRLLQGLHRDV